MPHGAERNPADIIADAELAAVLRTKYPAFLAAIEDEAMWTKKTRRLNWCTMGRRLGLSHSQTKNLMDKIRVDTTRLLGEQDR